MKIKIKVTKDVLKRAMWCGTTDMHEPMSQNCAISKALNDVFGKVSVSKSRIILLADRKEAHTIDTPMSAARFIDEFDALTPIERLEMPELTFEVELPESVIDQINISDIHKSETLEVVC